MNTSLSSWDFVFKLTYTEMCLLNVPYAFIVMFGWGSLGNPDDSDDGLTILQMVTLPFMIVFILVGIVLDLITFPFHVINLIQRRCMKKPYSPSYMYEELLCCGYENRDHPYLIYDDSYNLDPTYENRVDDTE